MWRQVAIVALVAGVALAAEYAERATPASVQAHAVAADQWQIDLLRAIGNDAPTQAAIDFLAAWHRAEGGTAAYNWLNSTQPAVGATMYNCLNADCSLGVRNYPDYWTGIEATAQTLANGFYPRTLAGLQSNNPVVDDGEMGVWGTGGGAVRAQLRAALSKCLPTATGAISAHFYDTSSGYWAGQAGGMHNGTDYSGNQGEAVYAPFAFRVEDIQYYGDAGRIGWYVQGRLQDGYLFYAGHLGTVAVAVGEDVAACQQIGTIGEVFHVHLKIASPDKPAPCEASGCDNFEQYWSER